MTDSDRIKSLDGLRTVSVALVIIDHLMQFSSLHTNDPPLRYLASQLGTVGVEMFFVISGFVITKSLLSEERRAGTISLANFYIRRFARILPPLLLYALALLLARQFEWIDFNPSSALKASTFTCNFLECDFVFGHTWSLAYEEQFYILFPGLFIVAGSFRRKGSLILLALLPVGTIGLYFLKQPSAAVFLSTMAIIAAGVFAAAFEQEFRSALKGRAVGVLVVAVAALIGLSVIGYTPINTIIRAISTPIVLLLIVMSSTLVQSPVATLLSWRPMVVVGQASYGIYLWQQVAVAEYAGRGPLFYSFSVLGSVALSLVLFNVLERPLMQAVKKRRS